jgi:hypothetical protein
MSVDEVRRRYLLPNLVVTHTRSSPVMLIGQHRSGTTVLGTLLRKYLKVNFGPESQFFFRKQASLSRYGDLQNDAALRQLVEDLAQERCFALNQFGYQVDPDKVMTGLKQRSYSGVIDTIFSQFAVHNGMQRWGDKTPEYVLHLPALDRLFPDPQYVHLVRDGRDVALSNFRVFFGAKNEAVAAKDWARYDDLAREFAATISADRFFEAKYEELMQDPAGLFRRLGEFFGVEDSTGKLYATIEQQLPGELRSGNFNKWKTGMSNSQQRRFERVAGEQLSQHGYERRFPDARPMSSPELAYWQLHHACRKYLRRGAWRDNFYKLGLRVRERWASLLKGKANGGA